MVDWEAGEKMGAMQSSYERGEREDEAGGAGVGQADDSSVSSVRPRDLERPPPFNYARPAGRSSLVAEYYRGYIYMFGGYNGTVVLNDFYKMKVNGWVEVSGYKRRLSIICSQTVLNTLYKTHRIRGRTSGTTSGN